MSSEITDQINTATNTINDKISALENIIPTLPLTGTQVIYTNDDSVVKTVQVSLHELDEQIGFFNDHVGDVGQLETAVMNNTNDISTLKTNIPTLPLSATQVNYTNAENEVKTVQVRLLEIDDEHKNDNDYDQSDIIQQISDMTGNISDITENVSDITENVSDTIENIGKIGETIEGIISSVTTTTIFAGITEAAVTGLGVTVGTMGMELAGEITIAAAIGAGAVTSIEILTGTIADLEIPKLPINATQVNYTKIDESVVH
jgi:hypothetical protein